MSGVETLTELIEQQGRAFEAFKTTNDERLDVLERRGGDVLSDEKIGRINGELDRLADQVSRVETAFKRAPRADMRGPRPYSAETMPFFSYLRKDKEGLAPDEAKALTVGADPTAGYLAPAEFARELIKAEVEFSPLRSVARLRTTANRALQIPARTGTFAAQWTAEQGTRSETTGLTYGLEEIPSHELYALVDVSEQMLEDSEFNLEEELQAEFAEQFAVAEGVAFVDGNGVGRPEGLLDHSDVASNNSGSAATIQDATGQANGLIDLFHGLKTAYARNGVWLLNRTTLGSVRKLKDGQNNYIWQPGLVAGMPNTILGAPYVEMPDMPDEAANAFPIAYGDWRRGYVILDRINLSVLRDPFTQATSGNIRYVARRRVGGQVVLAEAIRKLKCAV